MCVCMFDSVRLLVCVIICVYIVSSVLAAVDTDTDTDTHAGQMAGRQAGETLLFVSSPMSRQNVKFRNNYIKGLHTGLGIYGVYGHIIVYSDLWLGYG